MLITSHPAYNYYKVCLSTIGFYFAFKITLHFYATYPVLTTLTLSLLCLISILLWLLWRLINSYISNLKFEKSILGKSETAVFCGYADQEDKEVWIKTKQRAMHTQIIGTTNAGKTESVILPWAIQDIMNGRGLLIIDGKADSSLLNKLWAYTNQAGRSKDFKLFSLSNLEESVQFNPLKGGTAEEITERVFSSFEFENPYFRNLQYEVLKQILRIFESTNTQPTFQRLYQILANVELLEDLARNCPDTELRKWVMGFKMLSLSEREMRTSGLLTALGYFSHGRPSLLFNSYDDAFSIDEALSDGKIVYFQLPVLLSPFLGRATGKLVLQSLQAAIANRHRMPGEKPFFSVFLDDFSEYLYPGFVSVLNKSRSANIGIAFAHQALGDIKILGDSVANSILTNSNIKIFMRGNDPESAEYFSKVIGTLTATKYTEREKAGFFSNNKTGDLSAREVEEFIIHPNTFKQSLGVGEAVMIVPHERGAKSFWIRLTMFPDLENILIPKVAKFNLPLLSLKQRSLFSTEEV